jgi:2-aminoadipate transaminase
MRLNFSGVDEDDIREGIRRLGEVISEQVALYSTLTGQDRPPAPTESASQPLDNVRHLTRKRAG